MEEEEEEEEEKKDREGRRWRKDGKCSIRERPIRPINLRSV